jgi:hypothetical protein
MTTRRVSTDIVAITRQPRGLIRSTTGRRCRQNGGLTTTGPATPSTRNRLNLKEQRCILLQKPRTRTCPRVSLRHGRHRQCRTGPGRPGQVLSTTTAATPVIITALRTRTEQGSSFIRFFRRDAPTRRLSRPTRRPRRSTATHDTPGPRTTTDFPLSSSPKSQKKKPRRSRDDSVEKEVVLPKTVLPIK